VNFFAYFRARDVGLTVAIAVCLVGAAFALALGSTLADGALDELLRVDTETGQSVGVV
jgi:hypothetical protein